MREEVQLISPQTGKGPMVVGRLLEGYSWHCYTSFSAESVKCYVQCELRLIGFLAYWRKRIAECKAASLRKVFYDAENEGPLRNGEFGQKANHNN